ncbi:hypothetical protein ACFL1Z_05290 [Thermodesulfobacteriota bacterium]
MDPLTKTYVSFGLVILALFEFWAAMQVFGGAGKPGPHTRLFLRLHRIVGYIFLIYFAWISWVCLDLMQRLADARGTIHGALAILLFLVLLLKLSFARIYKKYRPYAPLLGIILAIGTLALWGIAGMMFLFLV